MVSESIHIIMALAQREALGSRHREIEPEHIMLGVLKLAEVDFSNELGQVEVNGTVVEEGPATSIMGTDPFEALVWIANELPKRGWHLRAGDFVVTGTVCVPPPVKAGDSARVIFTNLGSVSVGFVE